MPVFGYPMAGHFVRLMPGYYCEDGRLEKPVAFSCPSLVRFSSALSSSTPLLVLSRAPARLGAQKNILQQTLTGDFFIPACSPSLSLSLLPFFLHAQTALSVSDGLSDLTGLYKLLRIRWEKKKR